MRMMLLLVVLLVGCNEERPRPPRVDLEAIDRRSAERGVEEAAKYPMPRPMPPSTEIDDFIAADNARLDARENAEMIAGAVEDAAADARAAIDDAERRLQERMDEEEEKRQHLEEHERATREGLR